MKAVSTNCYRCYHRHCPNGKVSFLINASNYKGKGIILSKMFSLPQKSVTLMPAHLLTLQDQEWLFSNFLNCVMVSNMGLLKVGDWSSEEESDETHQNDLSLNRRWKLDEQHPRCFSPHTSLNRSVPLWRHLSIHAYILIQISHLWHDEKTNNCILDMQGSSIVSKLGHLWQPHLSVWTAIRKVYLYIKTCLV